MSNKDHWFCWSCETERNPSDKYADNPSCSHCGEHIEYIEHGTANYIEELEATHSAYTNYFILIERTGLAQPVWYNDVPEAYSGKGWYFGSSSLKSLTSNLWERKGPFDTKEKAIKVGREEYQKVLRKKGE